MDGKAPSGKVGKFFRVSPEEKAHLEAALRQFRGRTGGVGGGGGDITPPPGGTRGADITDDDIAPSLLVPPSGSRVADLDPAPGQGEDADEPTVEKGNPVEARRRKLELRAAPYVDLLRRVPQDPFSHDRERVLRVFTQYPGLGHPKRPYILTRRVRDAFRRAGLNAEEQLLLWSVEASLALLLYNNLVRGGDGLSPLAP